MTTNPLGDTANIVPVSSSSRRWVWFGTFHEKGGVALGVPSSRSAMQWKPQGRGAPDASSRLQSVSILRFFVMGSFRTMKIGPPDVLSERASHKFP